MTPSGRLRVGMIGLGTVGAQVAARLLERRAELSRRAGLELSLARVLVRDLHRPRAITMAEGLLTTEPAEVLDDPAIDVVVEVAGGEEPARSYLARAICNGKHVVTANKLVMAKHGLQLLELAGRRNVDVYFEAAVGGGIPLISTFRVDLAANYLSRIMAVINGTTNFVLGQMARGRTLAEAVAEAQAAGFAEADPTEDLEAHDAVYKLAIMASIGFGAHVRPEAIYREGIGRVDPVDFPYARELGYEVKLLAYAAQDEQGRVEARVHPVLLPLGHLLGNLEGAANAVYVEGDLVGPVLLQGEGAGGRPTASSVVGDLVDLARSCHRQVQRRPAIEFRSELVMLPMDLVETRAYFRCVLADRPGMLGAMFTVFGQEGVNIAGAMQKETEGDTAEFVVTTHPASDLALRRVRERIAAEEPDIAVRSFIRII
ncbi:MAG: homoserine dehydrogenase [Candidatus Dormibacteraeota bacterium]|uniref:Homoserine dehydrogenase n=1 Tax=Candidatus Dormiibacter inghamiae TaxID=3127013 RepID=A0A934NE62_9BACT|nr:homoserine dehydrogenase [Candidatus Dormibacteraeota bacterium]MBJ7607374.1 homoserine dehydrogenase [Candidatus Dormibacteraeota bacterium]